MKILKLYNRYRSGGGGESVVVRNTIRLLEEHGHTVRLLERDSAGIQSTSEKAIAALSGIYSLSARREIREEILEWQPDLVHVHNLYPLFTPSVLAACTSAGIPVVMTVHNYGLTCPVQTHLRNGIACRRCAESGSHQCIVNNCRGNLLESVAYSVRHSVAHSLRLFTRHVSLFLPVSDFVQSSLLQAGIPRSRTMVVPNGVSIPPREAMPDEGSYVLYLGRFTNEKGVLQLLEAARQMPRTDFRLYGDGPLRTEMISLAPSNVSLHPWTDSRQLDTVYRQARCVVLPSTWHDPCPMVALEAFSYGLPVVASRVGGLSSIVQDRETGLLVEPGQPAELASALCRLLNEPGLAGSMGRRAREVALHMYSEEAYFHRLMMAYAQVAADACQSQDSACRPVAV